MWFSPLHYGPAEKGGEKNPERFSDALFMACSDTCERHRHNGLLLKVALFPLEQDGISRGLAWIRRGEAWIMEMAKRGIYCQINLFDTWSRGRAAWFSHTTRGSARVFDVRTEGREAAKRNHIRTLVARFAGFHKVCWELGNEMEHSPDSGSGFARLAEAKYIPLIRQFDPYGLPTGLSGGVSRRTDVDIDSLHRTHALPAPDSRPVRPSVMNELVFGWSGGRLWEDSTIRSAANRLGYRRTLRPASDRASRKAGWSVYGRNVRGISAKPSAARAARAESRGLSGKPSPMCPNTNIRQRRNHECAKQS